MFVPEEFKRLSQCFWNGSDRESKSFDDWISRAIKLNSPEQRSVSKAFLREFLQGNPSIQDMQFVWRAGGSSYGFHDHQIKAFLEKLRDMID